INVSSQHGWQTSYDVLPNHWDDNRLPAKLGRSAGCRIIVAPCFEIRVNSFFLLEWPVKDSSNASARTLAFGQVAVRWKFPTAPDTPPTRLSNYLDLE